MDMETFVRECKSCDVTDSKKVVELLAYAAELGEAILSARGKKERIPYNDVMNLYNEICIGLPKAHKMSTERKSRIKSCFSQNFSMQDFEKAFHLVQNTPFLRGDNSRGWHATFDWLIKPSNLLKVLENTYGAVVHQHTPSYDLNAIFEHAKNSTPTI